MKKDFGERMVLHIEVIKIKQDQVKIANGGEINTLINTLILH